MKNYFFILIFLFFVKNTNSQSIDSVEYRVNYDYTISSYPNVVKKLITYNNFSSTYFENVERIFTAIEFKDSGNPMINSLLSKGYIHSPIYSYQMLNDSIYDFTYFEYEHSDKILLKNKYKFSSEKPISKYDFVFPQITSSGIVLGNSQYVLDSEYQIYDSKSNAVQIKGKDGKIIAKIFDQDRREIAIVNNAKFDDIAYYSFQSELSKSANNYTNIENSLFFGNWQMPSLGVFYKPNLDFNKTYVLSAWLKVNNNSSLTINGATIIDQINRETTSIDDSEYKLVVYYLKQTSALTLNIVGNVTEMRLHPLDAQMSTFRYDIFNNVTRYGDVNQVFKNFKFDNLGRETEVKGHYNSDIESITSYRYTSNYQNQSNSKFIHGVQHSVIYDGIGREIYNYKEILRQKFLINSKEYDGMGREHISYLPFVVDFSRPNNFYNFKNDLIDFYSNTTRNPNMDVNLYPFVIRKYNETSGELKEQGNVGNFYQPQSPTLNNSGHTTKYETKRYSKGGSNFKFKYWVYENNILKPINNYQTPILTIETIKGPNWTTGKSHTNSIYKDWRGNTLVDIQYLSNTDSTITYYIYDQFGRVSHVIPNNVPFVSQQHTSQNYKDFIYHYIYDRNGQVIEKKIPGQGVLYLVYNKSGYLVASQNSIQRTKNEWLFNKYDEQGRVIKSISAAYTGNRTQLQQVFNSANNHWETKIGYNSPEYTSLTFPLSGGIDLVVNYYDRYANNLPVDCPTRTIQNGEMPIKNGSLVASKTNVLGTNTYIWNSFFFDKYGRVSRNSVKNSLGFNDAVYLYYNSAHKVIKKISSRVSETGTFIDTNYYDYDEVHNPTNIWHSVKDQPRQLLVNYIYDAAGKVSQVKMGGTSSTNYAILKSSYLDFMGRAKNLNVKNKHGLLLFDMQYGYEDIANNEYRGNITSKTYTIKNGTVDVKYTGSYRYDVLNRLIYAGNSFGNTVDNSFNEYFKYDKLNNITNLGRYAKVDGIKRQIDSLSYTYSGMKHTRIDDISASASTIKSLGFSEKIQVANEYLYDDLGRMITDKNKGISLIRYNILNLPDTIMLDNGNWVAYQYAADGVKLRKHAKIGTQSSYTYYVNGIEYTSMNTGAKSISLIKNEIGIIKPNGSSYIYQFDISDNNGNNLLSINQNIANNTISIAQINSYYSFGNTVPYIDGNFVSGRKSNYLYNGKELQEETGLYDYHARMYDPAIGRWQIIDPLSESFYKESPYNYVLNNPINLSDPTGMYPYGGGTGAGIDPYKRIKELNYEAQTAGVPDWVLRGNNFQDYLFFEDYGYTKQDAMEREIQYKQWESLNSYKYWNPNEFYIRSMGLGFENFDNGRLIYTFELIKGRRPTQKELFSSNLESSRGSTILGGAQTALSNLDLAEKINDLSSGALEGATYKNYLGTIKPSAAYGFNVYSKPVLNMTKASPLMKGSGYLGVAISTLTVGTTWATEGHFGQNTKIATAKAVTSGVGAWAGAKIGAAAGGAIGAPAMGIGAIPGALIGGMVGAVVGSWGSSSIVDIIYR